MLCPYCEYGMVLRAKIKDLDKKIYICEECDTVWEEVINDETGVGFAEYMKKMGKNQGKKLLPDFYAETDLFPAAVSCSRGNAYGMSDPFLFCPYHAGT